MVNHCANPICHKPLHYLRDGKVFLFSRKDASTADFANRLEHFWLCGICSKEFTLTMDRNHQIQLQQTRKRRFRANYAVASSAPAA